MGLANPVGELWVGDTSQSAKGPQSLRCAWPVALECVSAGVLGGEPQDDRNDDRIVGVAKNRNEIRNQVDGRQQIDEEDAEPNANSTWDRGIRDQTSKEANDIGNES
jgi:hypothetical protein